MVVMVAPRPHRHRVPAYKRARADDFYATSRVYCVGTRKFSNVSGRTFAAAASAAPTPSGYTNTFTNLNASSNAYGYMGFTTLSSYDSNACAAKCNAITDCIAINIFFERDATLDVGPGCPNPPSTTNIKCVFCSAEGRSALSPGARGTR